jgi:dATP pyrophosphohydrolase
VSTNTEHWFGLELPAPLTPVLSPREHTAHAWLPWAQAAARCFSPSNAEAIRTLPGRILR